MYIKENKSRSFRSLAVLLILCLILFFAVTYVNKWRNKSSVQTADKNRTVVVAEELPTGIPLDLPFLSSGIAVENYTTKNGEENISTRKMLLQNGLEEVRGAYLDYFSKYGWETTTDFSKDGMAVLASSKEKQHISVSMTNMDGKTMLELTLTY